ncbi:MAG: glycosyltransferase family 39 protein [Candidatus Blackburnbacteria bacterium]|nr:glycosyltransferase family 39 protein [Candidatus Blackburnbacteria bacterium]
MRIGRKTFTYDYLAIALLTLVGSFLRLYNLNWDQGNYFHPDERNIASAVARLHFFNQLDPQFFAYGGFSIYLIRVLGELIARITSNNLWLTDWGHINLIARFISAFSATLLIPTVYSLAKEVFDKKTGLTASFLVVFLPSLIQTAHFGVTESLLAFLITMLVAVCISGANRKLKIAAMAGTIYGIALATKTSAISFFTPILLASFTPIKTQKFGQLRFLVTTVFVAFLLLVIFSPYTFLNWNKFYESMNYESGVVTGKFKVVYVLQFEKTTPYLFQLKNLFWQMGLTAGLGVMGIIILALFALKNKDFKKLIFLSFPITYFAYVGSWYTKFVRYMVPILPFLCLTAAWLLVVICRKYKFLGKTLITFFLLTTAFWGLAFFSIYTRSQTRIVASQWIYENIPEGAKILGEHWDDGLPLPLPDNNPSYYSIEQLTIYEPDSSDKIDYYADRLNTADYIIINSRRLYGTLINLPEKYPITSRYYQFLFSDQLGYKKVAEFSSYPQLFGLKIDDDKSEETFQVYDHPKVIIFSNQHTKTKKQIISLLSEQKNVD